MDVYVYGFYGCMTVFHHVWPSFPNIPTSSFIQFSISFILSIVIHLYIFILSKNYHTTKGEGFEGQLGRNLDSKGGFLLCSFLSCYSYPNTYDLKFAAPSVLPMHQVLELPCRRAG